MKSEREKKCIPDFPDVTDKLRAQLRNLVKDVDRWKIPLFRSLILLRKETRLTYQGCITEVVNRARKQAVFLQLSSIWGREDAPRRVRIKMVAE